MELTETRLKSARTERVRLLRRSKVLALGTSAGLAALAVRPRSVKAAEFEYKYHHDLPVDSPMHVRLVQLWNAVTKASNGRFTVKLFPNNTLGSDVAIITQIRAGAVEMASLASASATSLVPAISISAIGFTLKTPAAARAALDGGLGAAIRSEIEAKGLHVVTPPTIENGLRQITTGTKAVYTPSDLTGLKMRVAPARMTVDLFRTLGANPTPVDFAEVYTALQTKLVDGTDLPFSLVEVGRFYEVQHYLSVANHTWGGYWMVCNPEAWNRLPADIRSIIETLAPKYIALEKRDVEVLEGTLNDKLQRQGMHINRVDTDACRAVLGAYYARWKAEMGPRLWGLLEQYAGGKLG